MRLVYLSPVPWDSFAQRPHKFVEWYHRYTGNTVIWIEPYPVRLPVASDFSMGLRSVANVASATPDWLTLIKPHSLPLEPLPGMAWINGLLWKPIFKNVATLSQSEPCVLGVGKPSALALGLLRTKCFQASFYDAMDDFPAFFSGLSKLSMRRTELAVVRQVNKVFTSSTALYARWTKSHSKVTLVRNGLDPSALPLIRKSSLSSKPKVLGYVGTMGDWFDWSLVTDIALAAPGVNIILIGPQHTRPATPLPSNVMIMPAMAHADAMAAMTQFDAGLIPFQISELTESVDPIKYYEYRALSLPVISTSFGEMRLHAQNPGTFILQKPYKEDEILSTIEKVFGYAEPPLAAEVFIANNTWDIRFEGMKEFLDEPTYTNTTTPRTV